MKTIIDELLLLLLLLFNELSEEKIFTIICNQIPR